MLLLLVFLSGIGYKSLWSQEVADKDARIAGTPYITNFSPVQYGAHKQNWGIVQDHMGILYFANGDGVLIYNGSDWQLVELAGQSMAASLAVGTDDQIYVGGWGTFGKIEYDLVGKPLYRSLSETLGEETVNFTRVIETIATPVGVYFQTPEAVYRYRPDEPIHTWYMGDKQLGKLMMVDDRLFLKWHWKGIFELIDDEWQLLPDSDQFKSVFVRNIMPFSHDKLLFASDTASLYLYDGRRFTEFKSEATGYLRENRMYCGTHLQDTSYIFGTVRGGIIGVDRSGKINLLINDPEHLLSLNIRNFLLDRRKNLWLAMDSGIAMIEYPSPFMLFKIRQKEVEINAFARVKDQFFVGTAVGLRKYLRMASGQEIFESVPEFSDKIWDLAVKDDRLLVADEYGIHELRENGSVSTIISGTTPGMQLSKINSNRLYVFFPTGMTTFIYDKGRWTEEKILPEFNRRVSKVVEENAHTIWLDTDWDELWKVTFEADSGVYHWSNPTLFKYDTLQGLPPHRGRLYLIDSSIYFVPGDVAMNYRWNEKTNYFEKDSLMHLVLNSPEKNVVIWHVDNEGNCWYVSNDGSGMEHMQMSFLNASGQYENNGIHFDRILDDIGSTFFVDSHFVWHGGFSTIVKQDIDRKSPPVGFLTLINQVIYQTDSTLSYGSYSQTYPELAYSRNAVTFHYSATEFVSSENLFFQTFLEGYDTAWSDWSKDKQKQYFGLSPDRYTFQVRARNAENQLGSSALYSFRILRPWYQRWWAYVLYVFWGVAIVKAIVRWRSTELIQEKEKLEFVVRQRTEDVEIRNQQLEVQKSKLAEQAQKLQELDQLKTNLFANISHEFRTPLTLIKAPVEQLERDQTKVLSLDEVSMIKRNADRLLRLVNQLLDLSKLDARSLQLDLTEGDLFRFFRVEASSFSSLAAQKNIDYQIKIPTRQFWTNFDRDKLETIVYNLLNNAFKFTPADGQIVLTAEYYDQHLKLKISDNGPGIPPEHLEQVFDRFYQVVGKNHPESVGTGIGLALCRELAMLMGGQISVESRLQVGTTFLLSIPLKEILNGTSLDLDHSLSQTRRARNGDLPITRKSDTREIILIVEDHPEMRRYIRSVIEDQFIVIEVENGVEGFERATSEIPDLIITDTMMPLMDGHELSQAIKSDERTSHIPVIMLTAKATLENKLVGLSSGVDSYLTKPFNALELEASIRALLVERKRLRKLFSKQLFVAPKEVSVNSLDQQFLQKVMDLLERQYGYSTFGVPQMQKDLVMSKTQLHRKLTAITNQSPGEFLRNFRLQRAAQILAQKGETVTQVAYAVGFENVPYFTKCFKDLFGVNPSQYDK